MLPGPYCCTEKVKIIQVKLKKKRQNKTVKQVNEEIRKMNLENRNN